VAGDGLVDKHDRDAVIDAVDGFTVLGDQPFLQRLLDGFAALVGHTALIDPGIQRRKSICGQHLHGHLRARTTQNA